MLLFLAALTAPVSAADTPTMNWTDVQVTHKVAPNWPAEFMRLNTEEKHCVIRFYVDENGEPFDIILESDVEDCPELLHPPLLEAANQWRFSPYLDETGTPLKSTFTLKMTIRPRRRRLFHRGK